MLKNLRWKTVKEKRMKEEVRSRSGEWFEEARKNLPRKPGEDCSARIFSWLRKWNLQRKQDMQEGSTQEEEMKQQQRMKVMKDTTRQIRAKGRMDANSSWWVSELLAADCEKAWLQSGWEEMRMQKWYDWL